MGFIANMRRVRKARKVEERAAEEAERQARRAKAEKWYGPNADRWEVKALALWEVAQHPLGLVALGGLVLLLISAVLFYFQVEFETAVGFLVLGIPAIAVPATCLIADVIAPRSVSFYAEYKKELAKTYTKQLESEGERDRSGGLSLHDNQKE